MLQQDVPEDYVIATGETHSVREFVEKAFSEVGINIDWNGSGVNERGLESKTGRELICIDPRYFRPTEVDILLGDSSKAKEKLGWQPKVTFRELISKMVREDIREAEKDVSLKKHGFDTYNHFE